MKELENESPKEAITQWLSMLRRCCSNNGKPDGYTYAGIGDFLLQHGVWYEAVPFPSAIKRGAPRSCFGNALLLAMTKGLRYVEGYATADLDKLPFPCHHAWNLDSAGNLIDSTWMNTGLAYFGVEFSAGRAENAIWTDDASVLDNRRSNHLIFRDPWTGEDFAQRWPKNKKLKQVMRELRELDIC